MDLLLAVNRKYAVVIGFRAEEVDRSRVTNNRYIQSLAKIYPLSSSRYFLEKKFGYIKDTRWSVQQETDERRCGHLRGWSHSVQFRVAFLGTSFLGISENSPCGGAWRPVCPRVLKQYERTVLSIANRQSKSWVGESVHT
jgi:hypothetical protein